MSGHNGLDKFLRVNRDEQALNFQVIGATAQYGTATVNAGNTLTPADLITGNVTLATGVASPVNFPSGLVWEQGIEDTYPIQEGACIDTRITNETLAPITIQLPGAIVEGNPPRNTSMVTCDGTNQIVVPACTSLTLMVCNDGDESYVVYPVGGAAGGGGGGGITSITNVGAGSSLVQIGVPPNATIRSLIGGDGINTVQNVDDVTINFDGANVGAGSQVFIAGPQAQFRTVTGGDGITATQTATEIDLDFDGVNTGAGVPIFVPGAQAQFKTLLGGTGTQVIDNATDITILSTVTQQIAYNNSQLFGDDPTIAIDDTYPMTYRTGLVRFPNTDLHEIRDVDNFAVIESVIGPAPNPYLRRAGRPPTAPDFNVETPISRNITRFINPAHTPYQFSGMRSVYENSNFGTLQFGTKVEGRPMTTDVTPSLPLLEPRIIRGDGNWYVQSHPDDPNTGWKVENYPYYLKIEADNIAIAPPVAIQAGITEWGHFGENMGLSPAAVQIVNYPVGTHFSPNEQWYPLGGFTQTNGPLNGNPDPAFTGLGFAKNFRVSQFTAAPAIHEGMCMEIEIVAFDYTSATPPITYCLKYILTTAQSSATFNWFLTLVSSTQSNNDPVNHPPPVLTAPIDPRPGAALRLTNGPNALQTNRKFFYQAYVRRKNIAIYNPA